MRDVQIATTEKSIDDNGVLQLVALAIEGGASRIEIEPSEWPDLGRKSWDVRVEGISLETMVAIGRRSKP